MKKFVFIFVFTLVGTFAFSFPKEKSNGIVDAVITEIPSESVAESKSKSQFTLTIEKYGKIYLVTVEGDNRSLKITARSSRKALRIAMKMIEAKDEYNAIAKAVIGEIPSESVAESQYIFTIEKDEKLYTVSTNSMLKGYPISITFTSRKPIRKIIRMMDDLVDNNLK